MIYEELSLLPELRGVVDRHHHIIVYRLHDNAHVILSSCVLVIHHPTLLPT